MPISGPPDLAGRLAGWLGGAQPISRWQGGHLGRRPDHLLERGADRAGAQGARLIVAAKQHCFSFQLCPFALAEERESERTAADST